MNDSFSLSASIGKGSGMTTGAMVGALADDGFRVVGVPVSLKQRFVEGF